jgi:hypothetical protein
VPQRLDENKALKRNLLDAWLFAQIARQARIPYLLPICLESEFFFYALHVNKDATLDLLKPAPEIRQPQKRMANFPCLKRLGAQALLRWRLLALSKVYNCMQ